MARRILPSLSALRIFEAAARLGSFTRAASELSVTQTAVSHQIKTLEGLLGVRLFVRNRNALRLTDAAQEYLVTVRSAISQLAQATESLCKEEYDTTLTVNSLATFSVKCLIPRLSDFRSSCPEISLRITASASFEEFDKKVSDVAIRLGNGDWPGMHVRKLFPQIVFPVCSPALMNGPRPLRTPPDLSHHVLIRSGSAFLFEDAWPIWLKAAGIEALQPNPGLLSFEYTLPAIEAAVFGLGVALGRRPFVDDDLKTGKLIRPFEQTAETNLAYYVVSPLELASRPKVRRFREWLMDNFATSSPSCI